MLHKPPIHCKNELHFLSHVTVNCFECIVKKLLYFLGEKFHILYFKFLSVSSEARKSAKFKIMFAYKSSIFRNVLLNVFYMKL